MSQLMSGLFGGSKSAIGKVVSEFRHGVFPKDMPILGRSVSFNYFTESLSRLGIVQGVVMNGIFGAVFGVATGVAIAMIAG